MASRRLSPAFCANVFLVLDGSAPRSLPLLGEMYIHFGPCELQTRRGIFLARATGLFVMLLSPQP